MRKLILAVWTLIPLTLSGQSFEGTLTYAQDFELSKAMLKMGITKEMFMTQMKSKPDWFDSVRRSFKGGNYNMITNSKNKIRKIYSAQANKIYSFSLTPDGEICAVQNAVDLTLDGKPDKPQVLQPDTVALINGYKCKLVRMKWQMSQVDYYYSPGLCPVKADLFAAHTSEGLSDFLKISGTLPVRIVIEAMGISIIHTLTAVKPGPVTASVFNIPELMPAPDLNVMKIPGMEVFRVKK